MTSVTCNVVDEDMEEFYIKLLDVTVRLAKHVLSSKRNTDTLNKCNTKEIVMACDKFVEREEKLIDNLIKRTHYKSTDEYIQTLISKVNELKNLTKK